MISSVVIALNDILQDGSNECFVLDPPIFESLFPTRGAADAYICHTLSLQNFLAPKEIILPYLCKSLQNKVI